MKKIIAYLYEGVLTALEKLPGTPENKLGRQALYISSTAAIYQRLSERMTLEQFMEAARMDAPSKETLRKYFEYHSQV